MTGRRSGRRQARRRAGTLLAALLLPLAATSAGGAPPVDTAMFEELRRQDLRIAAITMRLAIGSAAFCPVLDPQPGLVLHDAAQYAPDVRAGADRHFRLNGGTGIEAVVPGGAGARAGIRQDDRIVAIDGVALPQRRLDRAADASPAAMEQALRRLLDALRRGPATIEVERDGRRMALTLAPVAGCRSRVELMTSDEHNSWADGERIGITAAMAQFARDDNELAALIAHEMAHNIYGHAARLRAAGVPRSGPFRGLGKNGARVRATEIEADRASIYLLAAAGYDIEAAPRFWQRLGDSHGVPGILSDGTHPSTTVRVQALREAIAEVRAKQARGAAAGLPGLPARLAD